MVKVCEDEFPMGSYPKQNSPGYYIDGMAKTNLDVLAKNITQDMQFVALYTGDGTVRNGKSTCAMQHAYYYSWKVSKLTGKKIPFTVDNIVFRAKDLIEKAYTLPRYSCIVLDEGDDLTAHYFSKLSQELKKFFRKCGQLNLFIILILPNFFELPKNFALTRSNYLCNVYFTGEFKRGYFNFYGQRRKKNLYLQGKREENYQAAPKELSGRFVKLYTVDEEAYRAKKLQDMMDEEEEEVPIKTQLSNLRADIAKRIKESLPQLKTEDVGKLVGVSRAQVFKYLKSKAEKPLGDVPKSSVSGVQYVNILDNKAPQPVKGGFDLLSPSKGNTPLGSNKIDISGDNNA